MVNPAITVLMAVYDPPLEMLAQALDSIAGQTFTDFEFLIIDDGSRDPVIRGFLARRAKGDARMRMRLPEIRGLVCTDHLKEIVYRCIGERRKRYESADEMIEALRNPPAALKAGVLRTLKGAHVTFTGILTRKRSEAIRAAKRAGAIVHGGPSSKTTVVVRGRPNPLQAAGKDAGLKLMEIRRLRGKGHRITLLNEHQFWRLAAAAKR